MFYSVMPAYRDLLINEKCVPDLIFFIKKKTDQKVKNVCLLFWWDNQLLYGPQIPPLTTIMIYHSWKPHLVELLVSIVIITWKIICDN